MMTLTNILLTALVFLWMAYVTPYKILISTQSQAVQINPRVDVVALAGQDKAT